MPGEAELVSQAKGYDPIAQIAKREFDSYYETFGATGRDTDGNWGLTIEMIPDPAVRQEMWRLRGEAQGMKVEPNAVPDAAVRPSAADMVGPGAPEPTVVNPVQEAMDTRQLGEDMREKYQGDVLGTSISKRNETLAGTAGTVDKDIAARQGTGSLPEAPGGTQQASAEQPAPGRPYDTLDPGTVNLSMSQSSNQGTVEPQQAKDLRDYALREQMRASYETQNADYQRSQEQLRVANERQAKLIELARQDAAFQARQNKIAETSEQRIAAAEQALKDAEPDPNFNPMREIWEGGDWGKKILFMIGAFAGGQGAAISGGPNQFFEQFEKATNRKIDLMAKRYNARKDQLAAAQDGYGRMRQILQDEAATRAMIEARAWQMFDAELDKIGQQYNLNTNNAQFRSMRAQVALNIRKNAMEAARTTTHTVGTQEQQKDLKIVPLGGGEDKTGANIKAIVQARQVKELPLIEGALDNMATGIASMAKDESARDQLAIILRTGNGLGKPMARYLAHDKAAYARIGAALGDYARIKSGTAQTKIELENLAGLVGTGDLDALRQFYSILQNERRTKQADIQAMDDYDIFEARKGAYAGAPKTQTYEPRVDPIGSSAVK